MFSSAFKIVCFVLVLQVCLAAVTKDEEGKKVGNKSERGPEKLGKELAGNNEHESREGSETEESEEHDHDHDDGCNDDSEGEESKEEGHLKTRGLQETIEKARKESKKLTNQSGDVNLSDLPQLEKQISESAPTPRKA